MPSGTVLLLGTDAGSVDAIRGVLESAGYHVTVSDDPERAVAEGLQYELIVLDQLEGMQSAFDVCRDVRSVPALGGVAVLAISQTADVEERVQFLELGADEVVTKPIDAPELEARVEAVLLRFRRSREMTPAVLPSGPPRRGQGLIAFFSPKGGAGTTTATVNAAAVFGPRHEGRVAIFDLDLQWGQVGTYLDLTGHQTIVDLCQDEHVLSEPELLSTYAQRHEASTLQVFPAPNAPDQVDLVTPAHVARILGGARSVYEVVIVDAGSTLDERALTVFEMADTLVYVINPEIASIKALHALLDVTAEAGGLNARSMLVVNHLFAREMVKLRDIESTLSTKVDHELPYDPVLYLKAVNEGVPVVIGSPRTGPARAFERLVDAIVARPTEAPDEADERGRRGLAGLLRRG